MNFFFEWFRCCILCFCVDSAFAGVELPDIIFVLVDSLRSDHVGCYGYSRDTTPFIDRFSKEECVRFETVIPGGSWTQPAVMTLFTAMSVDGHFRKEAEISLMIHPGKDEMRQSIPIMSYGLVKHPAEVRYGSRALQRRRERIRHLSAWRIFRLSHYLTA